ncbi:MAG TPA: Rieske 2Fe-2S domain-containing protein [Chloroflexota bacterium]
MRRADHERLARTGPGTPMGNLLRRYWVPALLSEEVREPDGAPVRVRLLGERLVAFRGADGQVGLLGEHCAHRGASLYFGRNAGCGLRCAYHGWKYDLAGNCLEMPNEAPSSRFKAKIHQTAYPCVEQAGVVWAYLGPAECQGSLPELEYLLVPDSHVYVSKRLQECHWTQGMDGDLDSSHVPFLHGSLLHGHEATNGADGESWEAHVSGDNAPKIEARETAYGLLLGARRGAGPGYHYWGINQWLMPWYTMIPPWTGDGPIAGHAWVPIDDAHCWAYAFTWHPTRPLTTAERAEMLTRPDGMYSELMPGTYRPRRGRETDYADPAWPPEAYRMQRIRYFQDQDVAITESMGARYDRTQEHLGPADRIIIQVRKRLLGAARALQKGTAPPGPAPADYRVRQLSIRLPRTVADWQEAVAPHLAAYPETFIASA